LQPIYGSIFAAMAQKKLYRFAQIKAFENVLEYPEGMKGNWKNHFKNDNPIVLELACGRGEYTVALSKMFPEKNFIGVDVKGNRMYIGAKAALQQNQSNAAFLRTQIEQINSYFDTNEVSEIWITFPDPQLRISKAKKRLTHPRFLRLYQSFLQKDGPIHLKTDSPNLFNFTKKVIGMYSLKTLTENNNVHKNEPVSDVLKVKTYYESLDIAGSNTIHYLQFALPTITIENKDDILQAELVAENNTEK
jgi:tRNA (guanine-N7-)-methyltransferase